MGRRLEPKCKQCRREGEKLYLKGDKCFTAKCPVVKRSYRPGMHGPSSAVRPTPYGLQLREKQKAKNTYGIMERQFRGYFEKATKLVGNTGDFFVQMLEMRLDNVIYRLGFSKSRAAARQLISHGHAYVNGRRVTIASYQTKPGDVIALSESVKKSKLTEGLAAVLEKQQVPVWLTLDAPSIAGKVLAKPTPDDVKQNFDPKLIVEFYSR